MSRRNVYLVCFIMTALSLLTGFYLEYFDGIMPCPLCTLQRICFAALAIFFLLGVFLHRKKIARISLNLLILAFSALGAFLAARQIWIQYNPDGSSADCGVSLQYMLQVLPLQDVAQRVFSGTAECTQRGWEFLNLNIPEWSILFFIFFAIVSLVSLVKECRSVKR